MINTKILPIHEGTLLKASNQSTHILSLCLTNPDAPEWFSGNYIQLLMYSDTAYPLPMFLNFHDTRILYSTEYHLVSRNNLCPFLDIYRFPYDVLYPDIIESIKKYINQNYYISLYIDTKYISNYQTLKYMHNPLIYGYDDSEGVLYMMDFWGSKYESQKIDYVSFLQAAESFIQSHEQHPLFFQYGISCFKIIPTKYTLNVDLAKTLLLDYTKGNATHEYYKRFIQNKNCHLGISILDYIIDYIDKVHTLNPEHMHLYLCVLSDHKTAMSERINWFFQNNHLSESSYKYLKEGFLQSTQIAEQVCYLSLKYRLTYNTQLLCNIKEKLILLKKLDLKYISDFSNSII